MKLHNRLLITSIFCLSLFPKTEAADFEYFIVPLKGLTGISQSALKDANQGSVPQFGAMIDSKYVNIFFDDQAQKNLTEKFRNLILKAYPKNVIAPHQVGSTSEKNSGHIYDTAGNCGSKIPFVVKYQHAFVASIGISRLSAYINDYGDKSQILVPVTYTVRFVKINGAEVVFSKSQTIYTIFDAARREFYDQTGTEIAKANIDRIKIAIANDGEVAIQSLTQAAIKGFSPKQTEVSLIKKEGVYYIFDKGSEIGFKSGVEAFAVDSKNKEYAFNIKYATDKISVGVASLTPGYAQADKLTAGSKLNFEFDSSGVDDDKLSVLAVQYDVIDNQPISQENSINNALQSIISDDLGFTAPFNLVKQDPDFWRLKTQIRSEVNCDITIYAQIRGMAEDSLFERASPDLVIKTDHYNSPQLTVTGAGGVTSNTTFSKGVTVSLIDLSGVVRQSFLGIDNYLLTRTDGKGLSPSQASEVSLKNASNGALKQLLTGFNPKKRIVKITAIQNGVATLDIPITPDSFKQFKLVRPLNIGTRQILLPLLSKDDGTGDAVKLEQPTAPGNKINFTGKLAVGDILIQPYADDGINPIKQCKRNGLFLMHGAVKNESNLNKSSKYAIAPFFKEFDYLEENLDFINSTGKALKEGFFEAKQMGKPIETQNCFTPVEMQQITKLTCNEGKCNGTASIASGIRLFNGETKANESVNGANFEFKDIPEKELSGFIAIKMFELHTKSVDIHKSKFK